MCVMIVTCTVVPRQNGKMDKTYCTMIGINIVDCYPLLLIGHFPELKHTQYEYTA